MGTNYNLHIDVCSKCHRPRETLHIGKLSVGWRFLFHLIPGTAENVEDWKKLTKQHRIVDEYGAIIPYKEFWETIKHFQNLKTGYDTLINNYRFTDSDFS